MSRRREIRDNPCLSRVGKQKKSWRSETVARYVADWYRLKHGTTFKVYECPNCERWHVAQAKPYKRAG